MAALLSVVLLLPSLYPPAGLTISDLFAPSMNDTAGVDYACYRIPSMVWVATRTSVRGLLLAFAEGRRGSCNDQGDVRIVVRRSEDGGTSWSGIEQVQVEAGHTIGNPAPVADVTTPGSVHLVFARDDNQIFVTSSTDGGMSWSSRRNVTDSLKANLQPAASPPFVMPGPPGGVQVAGGAHAGRLVVGIYGADESGQVRSYAGFSDDKGQTWTHGSPAGTSQRGPVFGGGENQIVPFGRDGTLAMFLRGRTLLPRVSHPADVAHNHGLAWSTDGGASWSDALRLNISGSYCEGSAAATPDGGLLLSAPSTFNGGRYNLTLWSLPASASTSGGSLDFEYAGTLDRGGASYSSLLQDAAPGGYLALYERGPGGYTVSALSLARFTVGKA